MFEKIKIIRKKEMHRVTNSLYDKISESLIEDNSTATIESHPRVIETERNSNKAINLSRTHQAIRIGRNRNFGTQQRGENKTETAIELKQQFEHSTVVK